MTCTISAPSATRVASTSCVGEERARLHPQVPTSPRIVAEQRPDRFAAKATWSMPSITNRLTAATRRLTLSVKARLRSQEEKAGNGGIRILGFGRVSLGDILGAAHAREKRSRRKPTRAADDAAEDAATAPAEAAAEPGQESDGARRPTEDSAEADPRRSSQKKPQKKPQKKSPPSRSPPKEAQKEDARVKRRVEEPSNDETPRPRAARRSGGRSRRKRREPPRRRQETRTKT